MIINDIAWVGPWSKNGPHWSMDQWTTGEDPYRGPQWSSPHHTTHPMATIKERMKPRFAVAWLASHVTASAGLRRILSEMLKIPKPLSCTAETPRIT